MKMFNKKYKLIIISSVFIMCLLVLQACGEEVKTIQIAEQYGIAYAPLQVLKESGALEDYLGDDYVVEWVKLANTAAIREAMIAGDLDVGFMGIPPFLISIDNGMDWKIMYGLSQAPLGLVVNDPSIKSLEDLIGAGKIALPQPGSIQHILLSMTAEKQLGDASIFDQQLVSMKHPDGLIALNAGTDIVGHYTSPPFIFQELDQENNHLLTVGTDGTGGEFTFIVGVCREDFRMEESVYEALEMALQDSIVKIMNKDSEALNILANSYEIDLEDLEKYLDHESMNYNQSVIGVQNFSDFLFEHDYIKSELLEKDVIWNE